MIEFDENSSGQRNTTQEQRLDVEKMSAAMDMYFSMTDSLSLQEMLDIDIKTEIDSLVGGHNDLSGFNFSDLPPLELDDHSDIRWFCNNSNHSTSSIGIGTGADTDLPMVNPNAVMPIISLSQSIRSPSPQPKESHLTFSPANIKLASMKPVESAASPITNSRFTVKKDLMKNLNDIEEKKPVIKSIPIIKTVTKPLLTFKNTIQRQMSPPVTVTHINHITNVRTITHQRKQNNNNNHRVYDDELRSYPKPAYSYSCLIAMALKNSRTGSLPVSEIYNFMCKHFPYFKTAPTGWKNSVRHNLSLNKCFEKIEKPTINGSQRKGCLWAMNPTKISKMDEEVQKWSRKDPSAIRKAMIYPDNLEALERGDLKFSCTYDEADNFGDSCGSAESEEGSDSEAEMEQTIEDVVDVVSTKEEIVEEEDMGEDYDVEVADSLYEGVEVADEEEYLRVQMALAQKELLEYGRTVSIKRKRAAYVI
nr:uncharacterized protein LOC111421051 isoform X1 [Onthophagus taurus]